MSKAKDAQQRIADAAKRARHEAEARRSKIDQVGKDMPEEINGRDGPEPTRFGDWEVKGITSDF